nr:hypothetical protein [Chitinophagales bacterium]
VQGIGSESLLTLCDPQTSGGLLIAVDATHKEEFIKMAADNSFYLEPIGRFTKQQEKTIAVL